MNEYFVNVPSKALFWLFLSRDILSDQKLVGKERMVAKRC
jgi:hypothetical protein